MSRTRVLLLALTGAIFAATPAAALEPDVSFPGVPTWVFFSDKGVEGQELVQALLERRAELPQRALDRRERMRPGQAVDVDDLDVSPAYVDAVLDTGVTHRATSRWLNAVSVYADAAQLQKIEALPFVASTRPVAASLRSPDRSEPPDASRDYGVAQEQLDFIGVSLMHECGYTGQGIIIGVQDTGFDRDHESLQHITVIDEYDFVNDDTNTADEGDDMEEHEYHGTGVLSLIVGLDDDDFSGVVPDAGVILSKTEDLTQEEPIEEDYYVEGLEWIEGLGADIFSSSLGYTDWYTPQDQDGQTAPTSIAATLAVDRGLIMIIAVGNVGPDPRTLAPPADAEGVITVGSVNMKGEISEFSSRGPTADGRTKPDVVGPGDPAWMADSAWASAYIPEYGTSFATPLVAGVAALVLESNPGMTPLEMWSRLTSTASQWDSPDDDYGWGLVAAMDAAGDVCPCDDVDGDGYNDEDCGGTDCDDSLPSVNPGSTEICDGIDTDCDGVPMEGEEDVDGDGFMACANDCDDNNPAINPDAEDIPYDGLDQDCSGDDLTDADFDGVDGPDEDCDDNNPDAYPGNDEDCSDSADNDCDGDTPDSDSDCEGYEDWNPNGDDEGGCGCRQAGQTTPIQGMLGLSLLMVLAGLRRR